MILSIVRLSSALVVGMFWFCTGAQCKETSPSESEILRAAESWLSAFRANDRSRFEKEIAPPFIASGIDLRTGPLRDKCKSLGEERADMAHGLRLVAKKDDEITLLVECLLDDRLLRAVIPENMDLSGKPDRLGRKSTIRIVRRVPKDLSHEKKGVSDFLSQPETRLVELRGTDDRGISVTAVLLVSTSDGKPRVTGILALRKFEH